ncbi:unnamed protein product [Larinioides sclopetarius]|uniref:C2H2-type domain-containing protein n=1 Tax=Larinioides sclopetarius TaxID=280406 RepID=A0AAV1ZCB9_9ARAC
MKVHEGYPCKIPGCDKVFEKWTLYVQHVRDFHRPEYKCQVCSKVFSTSYALKLHAPIHEESRLVYPCEVPNCSRYYFAERNLKWHMRKYHAKRPFMCDQENCHRAFKTEADLADHILYHGKKKPRKKKNKPKKTKPSIAEILSGVAEIKQVNRKSKQVLTEEKEESNVIVSSSQLNLNDLELDTTKFLSIDSLESNQSPLEETPCVLVNERAVNCASSKAKCVQNLYESSQLDISSEIVSFSLNSNDDNVIEESKVGKLLSKENILEMDQSAIAEELDSVCSSEKLIVPLECEINSSSTKLKVPESAIQAYTTIEVVCGENLSQFISVPLIQIDKHWNKNTSVHIGPVS